MKKNILLVDDDPLVLKTLSNLLQTKGYAVAACKSGVEAAERFKKVKFDLVLTDVRMPEQDGIRTIKAIRSHEKNSGLPPVPIIIITGYASEDVPVEAIELGVDGYVLKPFDYERFLAAIETGLKKRGAPSSGDSGIEKLCSEMKTLIEEFHSSHDREIFENPSLMKLLDQLESCLAKIERELVKLV